MASPSAHPFIDAPERLTEFFRDDEALRVCALDTSNVVEYFAMSPFFDTGSLTQRIRMGELNPDHVVHLSGIEYVVRPSGHEPRLFIIERRFRRSDSRDHLLLTLYYVLDGSVFQCPDAATLLSARLAKAAFHIYTALQELEHMHAPVDADDSSTTVQAPDPRFDAAVGLAFTRT